MLCGYTVNVQCFLNHMYSGMENMIKSQKESIAEMTARLQALQEEMEKVTDLWGHKVLLANLQFLAPPIGEPPVWGD